MKFVVPVSPPRVYLLNRQASVVGVLMSSAILFFLRAKLSLSCF